MQNPGEFEGKSSKITRFCLKFPKISSFFSIILFLKISKGSSEGYKKSPDHKNSPEMNELERDLIAVQFLASNFEKQKF